MKQRIHREQLMFKWFTGNHEIVVGFKKIKYNTCQICGKRIPYNETICDECFSQKKNISTK
jgi:uncharacterized OB-fold protein